MKKNISALIIVTLMLAFIGCGGENDSSRMMPDFGEITQEYENTSNEVAESKTAEESRIAAESKAAEESKIATERKAAEESRIAAESKAAEESRIAAESKAAEESRIAAESKAAEESRIAAESKAAEESRIAAESKAAEESRAAATGSGNNDGSGVIVPKSEDTQGNLVWVPTKGGKKYHSSSTCSGMDAPMQVTLEHAIANGYTACKKCYK